MIALPTWQELADLIKGATRTDAYGRDGERRRDEARGAIQKAFTQMRQHSMENETLRQMLVDLGVENARLGVEIEREKARSAMTPPPAVTDPKASHTKASLPRKGERQ